MTRDIAARTRSETPRTCRHLFFVFRNKRMLSHQKTPESGQRRVLFVMEEPDDKHRLRNPLVEDPHQTVIIGWKALIDSRIGARMINELTSRRLAMSGRTRAAVPREQRPTPQPVSGLDGASRRGQQRLYESFDDSSPSRLRVAPAGKGWPIAGVARDRPSSLSSKEPDRHPRRQPFDPRKFVIATLIDWRWSTCGNRHAPGARESRVRERQYALADHAVALGSRIA